jgi:hypothetical protein
MLVLDFLLNKRSEKHYLNNRKGARNVHIRESNKKNDEKLTFNVLHRLSLYDKRD